ncbi:MAG: DUF1583 domain-containing protein [Planctomycetota bacterium]
MQSTLLLLLVASFGQAGEVHQDFRKGGKLHPGLSVFGPNVNRTVRHGRSGLRITLPRNREDTGAVGIEPQFSVSGDFEITLDYEILSADNPKSGMGAGVKIWTKLASEEFKALTLAHVITADEESRLVPILAQSKDGQRGFSSNPRTATGQGGRLRLTRTGSDVSFLVAEGESHEFEELQRETVGTEDLAALRISAGTANDPCGLRVVFHDLRIRAANLPAVSAPTKRSKPLRTWLVIGGAVAAVGGAGAWYWWKRQRR